MIRVNSDKGVTTLSANKMILYPIYVVMMNATSSLLRYFSDEEFSPIWFHKHTDGRHKVNMNRIYTE